MNYVIYQNKNSKSSAYRKYYARASYSGTVDTDGIADIIQRNCSMKKSDVQAVITELMEVMQDQLQAGKVVNLVGFGHFKIGLTSTGVADRDDFSVAHNIVGAHVNFLPTWKVNSATGERTTQFLTGLKLKELPNYVA